MKKMLVAAVAAVIAPVVVQAQVVGANSPASWTNVSSVNINRNSGDAYWDRSSSDGTKCNIGYYLVGGFGPCNNMKPAGHVANGIGSLGNNGSFLGNSSLMGSRNFSFAAGLYQIEFLGNIAGYDPNAQPIGQQLRAYIGGTAVYETVFLRTDNAGNPVYSFNLDASAGDWFFGAFSYGHGTTGQSRYSNGPTGGEFNRFALFSTATKNDTPWNSGSWYVGFEDAHAGDRDFNDLIVKVSRVETFNVVPEPSSVALMMFGLGALGATGYRRRLAADAA